MGASALGLFQAYGIELEYMIVDAETLEVAPVCDRLLYSHAGNYEGEAIFDDVTWSNELALHVVELKTSEPAPALAPLAQHFQRHVGLIEDALAPMGARLMPSAMHPWMDPFQEMRLWPHDNSPIYRAFDRIFDCRGHGWANLQSMHINLPFQGDDEFARLHAAIRLVLPLLPALAASSPVMDGRVTGFMDNRLRVYRGNSAKIASVAGSVIPEPVFSEKSYGAEIFQRMFGEIAPHDPEGILQHEWLNARGAIARFSRGTIEIRVIDVQECPAADLAIAAAAIAVIRSLVDERLASFDLQASFAVEPLRKVLWNTIDQAEAAVIDDARYLAALGIEEGVMSAGDVWRRLLARPEVADALDLPSKRSLEIILDRGTLARRLVRALGAGPDRRRMRDVYRRLCDCLHRGEMFDA